jgi:hypothetical protein
MLLNVLLGWFRLLKRFEQPKYLRWTTGGQCWPPRDHIPHNASNKVETKLKFENID